METLVLGILYKIVVPLFGIKAQQFYTDLSLYLHCKVLQKTVEFKEFSSFLFVCFVALRPKSTAMVIAGRSVHLTTLFPGQA